MVLPPNVLIYFDAPPITLKRDVEHDARQSGGVLQELYFGEVSGGPVDRDPRNSLYSSYRET